jgi:SH3 domain-containing protein
VKFTLYRAAIGLFFLVSLTSSLRAQEGATNRNVILRRDPATSSPALAHLPHGSRVELVDATPDSGFYHVRTEDDQVGWVYSKYVSLAPVSPPPPPIPPPTQPPATTCDPTLAAHVYHSTRLIVHQQCIAVSGTIVDATAGKEPDGVRHEPDGDTHGWLKVDPEFQNLLNAGNMSAENGNLVFEIVCKYHVSQPDAKTACANYTDHVSLPPVGSRVTIVGTYVQDTFHAQWMELHPVTSITVLP